MEPAYVRFMNWNQLKAYGRGFLHAGWASLLTYAAHHGILSQSAPHTVGAVLLAIYAFWRSGQAHAIQDIGDKLVKQAVEDAVRMATARATSGGAPGWLDRNANQPPVTTAQVPVQDPVPLKISVVATSPATVSKLAGQKGQTQ